MFRAVCLAAVCLPGSSRADDQVDAALVGSWGIVSWHTDGRPSLAYTGTQIVVTENTIKFPDVPQYPSAVRDDRPIDLKTCKGDPFGCFDLTRRFQGEVLWSRKGIFYLEDDILLITLGDPDQARPTKLGSRDGNATYFIVLRRATEDEDLSPSK
ncbi:MAG: hypothetical protein O3C40_14390 [Planctomycetota bacterium]|nr:hypothetical protein [Planctomycetota bacterium]